MPLLSNSRHELFAQGVSNGKTLSDAYVDAGFKRNGGNASTLHATKEIQIRIAELKQERVNIVTAKVTAEVEYTRERLLGYLEEAITIARDKDNPVGVTQATVAMARILGLIIDRREVGEAGAFDGMTDAELMEQATKKAEQLGVAGPRLVVDNDEDEDKAGVA